MYVRRRFPPHLQYLATVPCKIRKSKNVMSAVYSPPKFVRIFSMYVRQRFPPHMHLQGRRNEYESGGARIHPARSAGKFFLSCPPLFIQCPPKWRGTVQCSESPAFHRPRGYKVCKLSHCDELIYVIMEVDYKLCKAQRQTTRHH